MTQPSGSKWFCLHTRPQKEDPVARYCRETLGLESYFPRIRMRKTIRRVKRVVTRPLFPRYLFCRLDPATSFRAVRYAPDVVNIVSFGEDPTIVDDGIIADLKAWAGEAVDVITIKPGLKIGDQVQITDGPMRGLQAVILEARTDHERVIVLLSILACGARLVIDRAQLERIG